MALVWLDMYTRAARAAAALRVASGAAAQAAAGEVSGGARHSQLTRAPPGGSVECSLERPRGCCGGTHVHAQALALRREYVQSLISFGCVYCAASARPVAGEPSGRGGRGELQTEKEFQQWRREIATRRLLDVHSVLPAGAYVRVQVHPKRFPRAWSADWKVRGGRYGRTGPLNALRAVWV